MNDLIVNLAQPGHDARMEKAVCIHLLRIQLLQGELKLLVLHHADKGREGHEHGAQFTKLAAVEFDSDQPAGGLLLLVLVLLVLELGEGAGFDVELACAPKDVAEIELEAVVLVRVVVVRPAT